MKQVLYHYGRRVIFKVLNTPGITLHILSVRPGSLSVADFSEAKTISVASFRM